MEQNQIRYGQFRADSVDEENRTAEFVISTEAEDTYGTIFKADGWDLSRYSSNPIVSFNHNDWSMDPDQILGTSEVRVENGQLIGKVTFQAAEDNPLAENVFRKVKAGILRGASIRADVKEFHWGNFDEGENPELLYFDRSVLMAWSIVTVPSNPDALARNEKGLQAIRTACPKPQKEEDNTTDENRSEDHKTLSRFEAQLKLNENQNY